jgi:hypothetical protein
MDELADICPSCYGPQVTGKRQDEPDFIVCMDGNFQHRRHEKASVKIAGSLKTPTLFVDPEEVKAMELEMNPDIQHHIEDDSMARWFT